MKIYDAELVTLLFDTFPEAFNAARTVKTYEYRPGPWGIETVCTGETIENLAADILDTASAISIKGADGMVRAAAYIKSFRPAKVQKSELKSFTRAR